MGVPQAFAIEARTTRIEVVTEPTCTLDVAVTGSDGRPVSGAKIWLSPNIMRMPGGIFGEMTHSSEEPFRRLDPLPELPFTANTDREGRDQGFLLVDYCYSCPSMDDFSAWANAMPGRKEMSFCGTDPFSDPFTLI